MKEVTMNWELARMASTRLHDKRHKKHAMSRRQFARTAAGAAALTFGTAIWRPNWARAEAKGPGEPVPISGGTPVLGGSFHVFGPNLIDPPNAEPATITDFNGFDGLAFINGTVNRTNRHTGEMRTLPMIGSDMRFMSGVYRGA